MSIRWPVIELNAGFRGPEFHGEAVPGRGQGHRVAKLAIGTTQHIVDVVEGVLRPVDRSRRP